MNDDRTLLDRIATLEARLEELQSRQEIEALLGHYSRAIDWLDRELLERVFFDDAEVDYGFFKGTGKEFKPFLFDLERSFGRRLHVASQIEIAMNGRNAAEVESRSLTIGAPDETPGESATLAMFHGLYLDRVERRDGRWGIARRSYVLLGGVNIPEMPLAGALESLNRIGNASTASPLYRKLF